MPDDRLFHKRLGHSEKVGRLTDFEYIVWQAYILSADDFGVMRFNAVSLQADHDRLAVKPLRLVQKALACICGTGLLRTFEHQGQVYGFQHDWQDWQHVDYPRATIHPKPPMEDCTDATRVLFLAHPGGWRGKKARNLPEHLPKVSDTPSEGVGTPSEKPPDTFGHTDPLAVSRKPLAISRKPVAVVPAAADSRSKRPIYTSDRFSVFEWQFDEISKTLGAHFEAFDIHGFFDALSQKSRSEGLVIPRAEAWDWLQAQVLVEAKRRGLPMAGAGPSAAEKAVAQRARDEALLLEIQQDRRLRDAGR